MNPKESEFEGQLFNVEEDYDCDEFMDRLLKKMAKVFDKRVAGALNQDDHH